MPSNYNIKQKSKTKTKSKKRNNKNKQKIVKKQRTKEIYKKRSKIVKNVSY